MLFSITPFVPFVCIYSFRWPFLRHSIHCWWWLFLITLLCWCDKYSVLCWLKHDLFDSIPDVPSEHIREIIPVLLSRLMTLTAIPVFVIHCRYSVKPWHSFIVAFPICCVGVTFICIWHRHCWYHCCCYWPFSSFDWWLLIPVTLLKPHSVIRRNWPPHLHLSLFIDICCCDDTIWQWLCVLTLVHSVPLTHHSILIMLFIRYCCCDIHPPLH